MTSENIKYAVELLGLLKELRVVNHTQTEVKWKMHLKKLVPRCFFVWIWNSCSYINFSSEIVFLHSVYLWYDNAVDCYFSGTIPVSGLY